MAARVFWPCFFALRRMRKLCGSVFERRCLANRKGALSAHGMICGKHHNDVTMANGQVRWHPLDGKEIAMSGNVVFECMKSFFHNNRSAYKALVAIALIFGVLHTGGDVFASQDDYITKLEQYQMYNSIGKGYYYNQRDYPKALEWYQKALADSEKVLGKEEHPDTAEIYHNIALVYESQSDYPTALEWNQKALLIREKVLGKEHLDTATTNNVIARVYYMQGDYPKALEWNMKALAIREKMLNKEHSDIAETYNNIAVVYGRQGEHEKAVAEFLKAYRIFLHAYKEADPVTESTKNSMEASYLKTAAAKQKPFAQWLEEALASEEEASRRAP
jgi:tetratricopeptide (TPR) repeat protein